MTLTYEHLQFTLAPRPFRFYEQVDSTNDIAMGWLKQGSPSGAVVIADEQLKGRGRLGRIWHTPPGVALAVSVILKPNVTALARVSMLGAVAIAEVCEGLGLPNVGIKWPNDVQVNGRKVSGVLPEVVWAGDRLVGVVLGIGLNIRNDFSGTELAHTAISLEAALGQSLDRVQVLRELLARIDHWTGKFASPQLFDTWASRLNVFGKIVIADMGAIRGTAESVDDSGALLIRLSDGSQQRLIAGDIYLE